MTQRVHGKNSFRSLDEMLSFIDQISESNHETLGRWSAAQNFYHLAAAIEGSIQQLPAGYPWFVRLKLRPLRSFVIKYRFPPMLPIPAAIRHRLDPPSDVQFHGQKARLVEAIHAFRLHVGDHAAHPVLGQLTREDWFSFHLRHSSHHLSFIRIIK
jgi:hypothetical protein